ncbi:MAG: class B sortase [Ruminococcus sp.]
MDYTNASDFSDCNTIIYGHNMKNGSMFGKLKQLYEKEKYKDSKYLWICTPQGKYRYEIFSMQYADVNSDTYTLFSDHNEEFGNYLIKMQEKSKTDLGAKNLTKDDYIVTLSTCTSNDQVRFVVQARWVGTY